MKTIRLNVLATTVAISVGGNLAWGAESDSPAAEAAQNEARQLDTSARGIVNEPERYFAADNFSLLAGGGISSFTGSVAQDLSRLGGTWTVRGLFGLNRPIGIEGAYIGSAYPVRATDGDGGSVVSNGLEALVRASYPVVGRHAFVAPYLTAGIGAATYGSHEIDSSATGLSSTDAIFEIPVGAGIGAGYDRLALDLRFMLRPSIGGDLFRRAPGTEASGETNIAVSLLAGYRF
jgi:hypothetical protein